ncbi:MAG: hypothetical protein OEN50_17880, partial [Deltaproteobacteria bacterium]|nr:hypothetical protein [Deltaproteobacteria bacterium]
MRQAIGLAAIVILVSGCGATYIPPGAKADLQVFAPPDIQSGFAAKPTNPFPASIATVRVQAPTYSNYYPQQRGGNYGSGRYSVILTKEADEDSQMERMSKLPEVAEIVTINRILLPERLEGDREIRAAAAVSPRGFGLFVHLRHIVFRHRCRQAVNRDNPWALSHPKDFSG